MFDTTPRKKQELLGRPIADNLYRNIFGNCINILRFDKTDNAILDKHFAIDVQIVLQSGLILTGQEKFLSHRYASFKSITVEYEQNQYNHNHGDWFRLASQFYLVGYFTKDNLQFNPWVLLDWMQVVIATNKNLIQWMRGVNKDGHATASFTYCSMDDLPKDCIIAASWL